MTENIQPDVVVQHNVEHSAIQPVYAGDTILDRHINDLQDAIKKIQNILGETTNDQLVNVINNFSDLTAQINSLHDSLISEANSNIIKVNDNGEQYLTTQKASTEKEGVVKFASNIDNGGEDLVVSAAQFNNKLKELEDTLTNNYVPIDDNSKISQKYFPDNLLSDRVFGGIITASKVNGSQNITFTPEINIDNSIKSIYNFQIVTDGSNIEGKLPTFKEEGHSWEEVNQNIVTISSGDWIYSYYDDSNGGQRKYKIIKNLDDVTILGPNNTVVQKDNLNRYDLSSLFNNLKNEMKTEIEKVKNALRNELKGEIDEKTNGVARFYTGKVKKQIVNFTSGKLVSSKFNKAEITIPLSKDVKKGKISILSFYGSKDDIFYLDLRDSGVSTNTDINTDKINETDPNLEFIQGYYYHTGRRLYSSGGDYGTDSGWEYDASNDWYAKGYICSYWEVVVRSGGLYYNKQNEQYEIRLRLEGVYSRNTNPTSFDINFTYEIWDYDTEN